MKDGADKYDPRVIVRIRPGETMTAANYIELMKLRGRAPRLVDPLRAMAIRDKPTRGVSTPPVALFLVRRRRVAPPETVLLYR